MHTFNTLSLSCSACICVCVCVCVYVFVWGRLFWYGGYVTCVPIFGTTFCLHVVTIYELQEMEK